MQERRSEAGGRAGRAESAEANEIRLLAEVEQGNRLAFSQLYRAYFPRLARFLDRMTRNPALIEEIINDTLLVVWQRAGTFNHTSKVSTWIFAIAYRKALKAINNLDEPVEADADATLGEEVHEPEFAVSMQQMQYLVAQALDTLAPSQRTVVNLAYYHGMGYDEIATIMECPVNTVKTRMFNARARLRTVLAGQLE
ncbi:MAG: sigma-70 family RNA polymerase sigma factor [Pseudomonadota bacterium]